MHYTTSCYTKSSAPEDGQNNCPKHVELIEIINKPLLLHLFGVYVIYITAARPNKHHIRQKPYCPKCAACFGVFRKPLSGTDLKM